MQLVRGPGHGPSLGHFRETRLKQRARQIIDAPFLLK